MALAHAAGGAESIECAMALKPVQEARIWRGNDEQFELHRAEDLGSDLCRACGDGNQVSGEQGWRRAQDSLTVTASQFRNGQWRQCNRLAASIDLTITERT